MNVFFKYITSDIHFLNVSFPFLNLLLSLSSLVGEEKMSSLGEEKLLFSFYISSKMMKYFIFKESTYRVDNLLNVLEVKWSHSVVSDSAIPWTVVYQASLSVGFSWQEYWSGLPLPSPGKYIGKISPIIFSFILYHHQYFEWSHTVCAPSFLNTSLINDAIWD